MKPRPNDDVNKFFMCDWGRLNYRWMNRTDRAEQPMVRTDGALRSIDWDVAIHAAASVLRDARAFVLASPMLSNEALHLLSQLVRRSGGRHVPRRGRRGSASARSRGSCPSRSDRAANVNGAELFGFQRSGSPARRSAGRRRSRHRRRRSRRDPRRRSWRARVR